MTWQTRVAAWVVPLLAEYAVPDDATVLSDVELGSLGSATSGITFSDTEKTLQYPGLIPNYSVEPIILPQTVGVQYTIKALKAVGFYGVTTEVLTYEPKRLNSWRFPIDRKQFGFVAVGRGDVVISSQSIGYAKQVVVSESVVSLVTAYDDQFDSRNVFNSADKFACTAAHFYLSASVELRVSFLPIYEVWAVRFTRQEGNVCNNPTSLAPPAPPYPDANPAPPWMPGTTLLCQDNAYYVLRCTIAEGYSWVFNGYNN